MPIKLYGARRTGTNYIYQLLLRNFRAPVFISLFGWKHGPPPEDLQKWWEEHPKETRKFRGSFRFIDRLRYVVCVKDPYALCLSNLDYSRRFFKKPQDIATPGTYRQLCASFNKLYQVWWDFMQVRMPHESFVFRYEDALADFRAVLLEIEERFRLGRKQLVLQDLVREALPGTDGHTHVSKQVFSRKDYYLKKEYLKRLSPECRQAITDTTDWELMGRYGYKPETD